MPTSGSEPSRTGNRSSSPSGRWRSSRSASPARLARVQAGGRAARGDGVLGLVPGTVPRTCPLRPRVGCFHVAPRAARARAAATALIVLAAALIRTSRAAIAVTARCQVSARSGVASEVRVPVRRDQRRELATSAAISASSSGIADDPLGRRLGFVGEVRRRRTRPRPRATRPAASSSARPTTSARRGQSSAKRAAIAIRPAAGSAIAATAPPGAGVRAGTESRKSFSERSR